jgi:hypothetical protein
LHDGMRLRRTATWAVIVGFACSMAVLLVLALRSRALPGGYTFVRFPGEGCCRIVGPGGFYTEVGGEVVSYTVDGPIISGSFRYRRGEPASTFRIDTMTHATSIDRSELWSPR